MKSLSKILFVAFAAASLVLYSCTNTEPQTGEKVPAKSDSSAAIPDSLGRPLAKGEKVVYQCEMDSDIIADKPGKCPKCGMDLVRVVVRDSVKTTI